MSFFRGTSVSQNAKFGDKQSKLLKSMKFPSIYSKKVETSRVNKGVIREWVAKKLVALLGFEDDVVIEMVFEYLNEENLDPKILHINLLGFLEDKTAPFMKSLWALLVSAQDSIGGIPKEFIEAKKQELLERRQREESELKRYEALRSLKQEAGFAAAASARDEPSRHGNELFEEDRRKLAHHTPSHQEDRYRRRSRRLSPSPPPLRSHSPLPRRSRSPLERRSYPLAAFLNEPRNSPSPISPTRAEGRHRRFPGPPPRNRSPSSAPPLRRRSAERMRDGDGCDRGKRWRSRSRPRSRPRSRSQSRSPSRFRSRSSSRSRSCSRSRSGSGLLRPYCSRSGSSSGIQASQLYQTGNISVSPHRNDDDHRGRYHRLRHDRRG